MRCCGGGYGNKCVVMFVFMFAYYCYLHCFEVCQRFCYLHQGFLCIFFLLASFCLFIFICWRIILRVVVFFFFFFSCCLRSPPFPFFLKLFSLLDFLIILLTILPFLAPAPPLSGFSLQPAFAVTG